MKLRAYLDLRGESQSAFSRRSGVPQRTVSRICGGTAVMVGTAARIVRASSAEPAPDGSSVAWEDLMQDEFERVVA